MNEKEIKFICKLFVECSNKPISHEVKELIKQAIDKSANWGELLTVVSLYASEL